jgi:type IV secretory pathway ATPase VirB11/archaellum biosynthesis ATPase
MGIVMEKIKGFIDDEEIKGIYLSKNRVYVGKGNKNMEKTNIIFTEEELDAFALEIRQKVGNEHIKDPTIVVDYPESFRTHIFYEKINKEGTFINMFRMSSEDK